MLRGLLVLALAIASCSADALTQPQRLRGGGPLSWGSLIKPPAPLANDYGTENKLVIQKSSDLNEKSSFTASFVRKAANEISHLLRAATTVQGVDVQATVDGSGKITGEAACKNLVPGAKVAVGGELAGGQKLKDAPIPTFSGDYTGKNFVGSLKAKGSKIDGSAVYAHGNVQGGIATSYNAEKSQLAEPSLAIRYDDGEHTISAVSNGFSGEDVTASYSQTFNSKLELSGSFSTKGNRFSVGGGYKFDEANSVRGKVDKDGILNVGVSHKLSPAASLNGGFMVDIHNTEKRQLGLTITLS